MFKLKRPSGLKKPDFKNRKVQALSLLLIIALGFAAWALLIDDGVRKGEKVYAEAAGHKIYKKEIDDLIGQRKDISEHDAATVLADKYLVEALAKERGITVTDKELAASYDKDTLKQKTDYKYAYQNKLNQLYLSKLQAHNNGVYKGKMLVANFSNHVAYEPALPEDKERDPLLGDPKAIAKDKKYAKDFITDLYNKITSGEITFDQAIKMEHADPRLGKEAYTSLSHSGSFDTSLRPQPVFNVASIRQKINNIKAGEITKPFVVRVSNSLEGDSTAESYYLVVKMDQTSGSYTGMDFTQYLDQAKQRLGYKVYV
ncbi:MAG TPA: hypothetical protein VFX86_03910 [Candidatus Saccharimonadales bacterium]|nr:hypothetical protein [Candidatus Saccharimonadales bacterium]